MNISGVGEMGDGEMGSVTLCRKPLCRNDTLPNATLRRNIAKFGKNAEKDVIMSTLYNVFIPFIPFT